MFVPISSELLSCDPCSLATTVNGRVAAVGSTTGLHIWHVCDKISCVCFLPLSGQAFSGKAGQTLFDSRHARHFRGLRSCCCSEDGRYVGTCSDDRTIMIWDLEDGSLKSVLSQAATDASDPILCIIFHPSKRVLFSGSQNGFVHAWDWRENVFVGKEFAPYFPLMLSSRVLKLGIAKITDCWLLTTVSDNSTLTFWDAESGVKITQIQFSLGPSRSRQILEGNIKWSGHSDALTDFKFDSSFTRLATASLDGTCKIWWLFFAWKFSLTQ